MKRQVHREEYLGQQPTSPGPGASEHSTRPLLGIPKQQGLQVGGVFALGPPQTEQGLSPNQDQRHLGLKKPVLWPHQSQYRVQLCSRGESCPEGENGFNSAFSRSAKINPLLFWELALPNLFHRALFSTGRGGVLQQSGLCPVIYPTLEGGSSVVNPKLALLHLC